MDSKLKKLRLPKPGEGTRVRKESKYGEGGREVGGMARLAKVKATASGKLKAAPPPPPPRVVKKTVLPPDDDDDLPAPGGHPKALVERAQTAGLRVPLSVPIEPNEEGEADDLSVDSLMQKPKIVPRPVRTREEREEMLRNGRDRLPALRDNGEPPPAPEPVESLATFEGPPEEKDIERRHLPIVSGEERTAAAAKAQRKASITKYTPEQETALAAALQTGTLVCNFCTMAEHCPKFQQNSTCAYDEDFNALPTRDLENVLPALEQLADIQVARARRGYFIETVKGGGLPDANITRQIDVAMNAVERVARLKGAFQAPMKTSVTVSQTMTATATGEPEQQKGILTTMMERFMQPSPAAPKTISVETQPLTIDVPHETIEDS